MSGGMVGDTKDLEKDPDLTLGINLNHTVVDGEEPALTHPEVDQKLSQNVEVHDDEVSKLCVNKQSLVESAAASQAADDTNNHANTDGLDGNGENLNLGSENIDNKGHDLPTDNKGFGEPAAAAKTTDDSHMDVDAKGTDGSDAKSLNQLGEASGHESSSEGKPEDDEKAEELKDEVIKMEWSPERKIKKERSKTTDDSHMDVVAKGTDGSDANPLNQIEEASAHESSSEGKPEDDEKAEELKDEVTRMELSPERKIKKERSITKLGVKSEVDVKSSNQTYLLESHVEDGDESGTEEEKEAFRKEVETFYKESCLEFKAPKFYKEDLNLLKLWRAVIKLGGYEEVTSCKLWRKVGESFKPPKTCTTVSWTFRIFYEKALLEYEKHKMPCGELPLPDGSDSNRVEYQAGHSQAPGSGRARRDAAARAMQSWHSRRVLGNGEVCQPIIKEKNSSSTPKGDRQPKSIGLLKRKSPSVEHCVQVAHVKPTTPKLATMVIDIGPPADWVKINVQRTNDCFEIYALVPGLLREEVHVQSDPAGCLVISGQPEQLDNPWGVTPFKKVVSLPCRIDPLQTSAVVTMNGQLFVRVPFEQTDL